MQVFKDVESIDYIGYGFRGVQKSLRLKLARRLGLRLARGSSLEKGRSLQSKFKNSSGLCSKMATYGLSFKRK